MDFSLLNTAKDEPLRISTGERLITVFACLVPLVGVAISSWVLMNLFVELSESANAGVAEVMAGMNQASFVSSITLYPGILIGVILIVMLVRRDSDESKTAPPPVWFFAACAVLYLIPMGLYWSAHLMVLEAIRPNSSIPASDMTSTGAFIAELLVFSFASMVIVSIILLAGAVLPISSRSKSSRISFIGATGILVLLIGTVLLTPA